MPSQNQTKSHPHLTTLGRGLGHHRGGIDDLSIKTYENHKSFRAKLFPGKKYHGYSASGRAYLFGIKVHLKAFAWKLFYSVSVMQDESDTRLGSYEMFNIELRENLIELLLLLYLECWVLCMESIWGMSAYYS